MATEIQPVPPVPEPPDFPSLSDRRTGTYNAKAYAWALYYASTFVQRLAAVLANILNNATVAHERATVANAAAATADAQANLAMGYRNTATNAAGTATTQAGIASEAAATAVTARGQAVSAAEQAHDDAQGVFEALQALEQGPVASVNGKGGVVVLTATDIGATPKPSLTPAGIALAGGAMDCNAGDYFTETVNGSRTFSFTNIPAGAYFCSLEILHTSGTFTLPAGSVWSGGTIPTFQTNKRHVLDFQRSQIGSGGWLVTARTGFAP